MLGLAYNSEGHFFSVFRHPFFLLCFLALIVVLKKCKSIKMPQQALEHTILVEFLKSSLCYLAIRNYLLKDLFITSPQYLLSSIILLIKLGTALSLSMFSKTYLTKIIINTYYFLAITTSKMFLILVYRRHFWILLSFIFGN